MQAAITIKRDPKEVYQFWRDVAHLPSFMYNLESVTVIDDTRAHWIAHYEMFKHKRDNCEKVVFTLSSSVSPDSGGSR